MPGKDSVFKNIFSFFGRNALWMICLGLCIGSYYLYSQVSTGWLRDLFLHLATASFIALFLDVFFEYNFRLRHLEKWGSDVLQAVAGAMVPLTIVEELVAILKSEVVRRDCNYVIEFLPPPPNSGDNCVLLRRDVSYVLCNKVSRKVVAELVSRLENSGSNKHTKHLKLKVAGKETGDLSSRVTRQGDYEVLHYLHAGGLGPNGELTVFISSQELLDLNQKQNSYIFLKPSESLVIDPRNSYTRKVGNLSIRMHHPISEIIVDDNGRYQFPHAVLPGQGFDILWTVKPGRP